MWLFLSSQTSLNYFPLLHNDRRWTSCNQITKKHTDDINSDTSYWDKSQRVKSTFDLHLVIISREYQDGIHSKTWRWTRQTKAFHATLGKTCPKALLYYKLHNDHNFNLYQILPKWTLFRMLQRCIPFYKMSLVHLGRLVSAVICTWLRRHENLWMKNLHITFTSSTTSSKVTRQNSVTIENLRRWQ